MNIQKGKRKKIFDSNLVNPLNLEPLDLSINKLTGANISKSIDFKQASWATPCMYSLEELVSELDAHITPLGDDEFDYAITAFTTEHTAHCAGSLDELIDQSLSTTASSNDYIPLADTLKGLLDDL